MTLSEKLKSHAQGEIGVCVGLDPVIDKIPAHLHKLKEPIFEFNKAIIESTADFAKAYKPNLAFYEALGESGWIQLKKTIDFIPENKLIIADAKRGDIGNTAKAYSKALFSVLGADFATVNPYLGKDALLPFIDNPEKGAFILALTSNPGSIDIQELVCGSKPIYLHVVEMARSLSKNSNVGLVVGATKVLLLKELLLEAIDLPLLIPGIGVQGGDIETLKAALRDYKAAVYANASRSIIYASSGRDFAKTAQIACKKMQISLN